MRHQVPAGLTITVRTFAAGAGCGLLAGAFVVAAVVWQYGNVIGSYAANREYSAHVPLATDRWRDASPIDDVGDAVLRGADPPGPVATSGRHEVVPPPPSPEPVLTASPAAELSDRDLI